MTTNTTDERDALQVAKDNAEAALREAGITEFDTVADGIRMLAARGMVKLPSITVTPTKALTPAVSATAIPVDKHWQAAGTPSAGGG